MNDWHAAEVAHALVLYEAEEGEQFFRFASEPCQLRIAMRSGGDPGARVMARPRVTDANDHTRVMLAHGRTKAWLTRVRRVGVTPDERRWKPRRPPRRY